MAGVMLLSIVGIPQTVYYRVGAMPEIYEHRDALMKAVVMESYGTPDVLELRDVAKPTPKADEVLVRVHAASVNDWDWGLLQGLICERKMAGFKTTYPPQTGRS
jgi:hypothetical protein